MACIILLYIQGGNINVCTSYFVPRQIDEKKVLLLLVIFHKIKLQLLIRISRVSATN